MTTRLEPVLCKQATHSNEQRARKTLRFSKMPHGRGYLLGARSTWRTRLISRFEAPAFRYMSARQKKNKQNIPIFVGPTGTRRDASSNETRFRVRLASRSRPRAG